MQGVLVQLRTDVSRRWHAVVLAAVLAVYMAAIHYASEFLGIFGFLLLTSRVVSGTGFQIASAVYVSLPAIFLIAGILVGRSRVGDFLILAAQILAGIAVCIGIIDLGVAPLVGGAFGTEAALLVQFVTALSALCCGRLLSFRGRGSFDVQYPSRLCR